MHGADEFKLNLKKILVSVGAGFTRSLVDWLFVNKYSDYQIINEDALTFVDTLESLRNIEEKPNYQYFH